MDVRIPPQETGAGRRGHRRGPGPRARAPALPAPRAARRPALPGQSIGPSTLRLCD